MHYLLLMVSEDDGEKTQFEGCIPAEEAIRRLQDWVAENDHEHGIEENHHGEPGSD